MANVLITGGRGLVGGRLTEMLIDRGHRVSHLSRSVNGKEKVRTYRWNISEGFIEEEAIGFADVIVHLAGAGIADERWSANRKREIIDSRVGGANLLYQKVRKAGTGDSPISAHPKIKSFISASATGYYGAITSEKIFGENDTPADDFLGRTCKEWEGAAGQFNSAGIRTVMIRTGIVLSKKGGALPKMALPVKLFAGAPIGSGRQWMPWIHIDDLCRIYIRAIEDENMNGAYNAVAPDHKTNTEFTMAVAKILKRPLFVPNTPEFVFKVIFGELSDMILKGSRVSSEKIQRQGYKFEYKTLDVALTEIYRSY